LDVGEIRRVVGLELEREAVVEQRLREPSLALELARVRDVARDAPRELRFDSADPGIGSSSWLLARSEK
jgi:hypothetical protein